MTDKEKIANLEEQITSINVVLTSEKQMNGHLKKHIENLNFQLEVQSGLLDNFCQKIGDLKFKIKKTI